MARPKKFSQIFPGNLQPAQRIRALNAGSQLRGSPAFSIGSNGVQYGADPLFASVLFSVPYDELQVLLQAKLGSLREELEQLSKPLPQESRQELLMHMRKMQEQQGETFDEEASLQVIDDAGRTAIEELEEQLSVLDTTARWVEKQSRWAPGERMPLSFNDVIFLESRRVIRPQASSSAFTVVA